MIVQHTLEYRKIITTVCWYLCISVPIGFPTGYYKLLAKWRSALVFRVVLSSGTDLFRQRSPVCALCPQASETRLILKREKWIAAIKYISTTRHTYHLSLAHVLPSIFLIKLETVPFYLLKTIILSPAASWVMPLTTTKKV